MHRLCDRVVFFAILICVCQDLALARKPHQVIAHEKGGIKCLRVSSSGATLASASINGELCTWSTETWKQLRSFSFPKTSLYDLSWTAKEDRLLYAGVKTVNDIEHGVISSVDVRTGDIRWSISSTKPGGVLAIARIKGTTKLVTLERNWNRGDQASAKISVCIRDDDKGKIESRNSLPVEVRSFRLSSDGTKLAIGSESGLILVWDVLGRRMLNSWRDKHLVVDLEFGPKQEWIYGSVLRMPKGDPEFCKWHVGTSKKESLQYPAEYCFGSIPFSPNGKWIAVPLQDQGKNTVALWDGKQFHELDGLENKWRTVSGGVAWTIDSKSIVTTHGNSFFVWDVPEAEK